MDPVSIRAQWCKGCGICVAFCPKKALRLENEKAVHNPELCILCGMCELYCPDLAVTVDKSQKKPQATREVANES